MTYPVSSHYRFFIAKPKIMPGESITGYQHRVSGFISSDGAKEMLRLQGKVKYRNGWMFPSGLESLAELYQHGVPSAQNLLENHTQFLLLRPFLPTEVASLLRGHFLTSAVRGISHACGFGAQGLSQRWAHAICKSCIAEDHVNGVTYWRTAHLIPGLAICPYHQVELFTFCRDCVASYRNTKRITAPSLQCICGDPLIRIHEFSTPVERRAEAAISSMIQVAMGTDLLCSLQYEHILAAVSRRADELGYRRRDGFKHISNIVNQKVGEKTLIKHRFLCARAFRKALSGVRLPRNVTHNLILIYALFDTLEILKKYVSGESVPCAFSSVAPENNVRRRDRSGTRKYSAWNEISGAESVLLRDSFRTIVLQLKLGNPGITRTGLRSLCYQAYTFAYRFDEKWLNEIVPICRNNRSKEYSERKRVQFDESLSRHIQERFQVIVGSIPPVRASHRQLVLGHTSDSMGKAYFDDMPISKQALAKFVESPQAWRIRRTTLLIENSRFVDSDVPVDANLDLAVLSPRQFSSIRNKVEKWKKEKKSVPAA